MKRSLLLLISFAYIANGASEITLKPVFEKSADGIFHQNEQIHFGFELSNLSKKKLEVRVTWEVVTDQKIPISKSIPAIITVQQSEKRVVRYDTKISGPGFYKGTLKCSWDSGQVSKTVQVGYAPETLLPPLTREPDFKRFWDESRVKLQKVNPQY